MVSSPRGHAHRFQFIGGALCLDLVNTSSERSERQPIERLPDYDALVDWTRQVGLAGSTESNRLRDEAARKPGAAARAVAQARRVREALYRLFLATVESRPADPDDLDLVNRTLAQGMARRRLRPASDGYCWSWVSEADGLDWMLWPAVYSAAELLTSDRLDRVRQCGGETCDWLFLDTSRNRSRRWCDMSDCGNRAKARRHYARTRGADRPAD